MTSIDAITLEVADPSAAARFYADAFALDPSVVRVRAGEDPSTGFRGCTLSLVVPQPGNVDALLNAALAAGATSLKPAAKSLWGYGGVVQAPDGTIWKAATSAKKDGGPVSREYDDLVLLLGVSDVKATKQFYVERGLTVGKSFGSKYVDFAAGSGAVKLALYKRRALAKDAGVPEEGSGSHRIALTSDAGPFTDPDGFVWEAPSAPAAS
jgi:predicted lactoylglutathione lyase